jgi:carboxypeptidase C (cathepsin A)
LLAGFACAQGDFYEIQKSVTESSVNLPSGTVNYTATAAQLPLRNDKGEVECRMFYVAYTKNGGLSHNRPITFAFNGGPGSATVWLHMGTLGPVRVPFSDDGSLPKPPYSPVPNLDSWLDFTDIVCIDAPNTGYSRIAKPELASRYFGVRQDINAFTQFIKTWLKENGRFSSPVFLTGESYGGIRGSGLSSSLFDAGVAVNGFISISGTSNFMTLDGMRGNDTTYISFLPSMAACAWYHKKLNPRFKTVEAVVKETQDFIDKEYATALAQGDSLTDAQKDHIAAKLSEYTGLSKQYCLGSHNKIPEFAFFNQLLKDEGMSIGRYDGRITGKNEQQENARGGDDPSNEAVGPPYTAVINDYLTETLKVKTDMTYNNFGNVSPWEEPRGGYAETASDLRRVIARNPYFHVMYACGYYDLACPLNGTVYTVNHMGLNDEQRSRVSYSFYPAGHMMYIEKNSRKKLHDDAKAFVAAALK